MSTTLKTQKVKQESLIELVKKAGLDAQVYPRSITGYEPISFGEWIRELNIDYRLEDEMNSWGPRNDIEKTFKLLKKRGVLRFLTKNEEEKVIGGIRETRRKYVESKIDGWGQRIYASRYYLKGIGLKQNPWTLPLSRGVLCSLIEAQETQQFCRFEIWQPHEVIDPILIGFSSWHPKWSIESCSYTHNGRPTGDHFLPQCRVTYKICAWE